MVIYDSWKRRVKEMYIEAEDGSSWSCGSIQPWPFPLQFLFILFYFLPSLLCTAIDPMQNEITKIFLHNIMEFENQSLAFFLFVFFFLCNSPLIKPHHFLWRWKKSENCSSQLLLSVCSLDSRFCFLDLIIVLVFHFKNLNFRKVKWKETKQNKFFFSYL